MNESNPTPPANPLTQQEQNRLLDLLADHALGELTPAELQDMNTLLEAHPKRQDDALEEAAALLCVAEAATLAAASDTLPAGLVEKLAADAERFVEGKTVERLPVVDQVASPERRRSGVLAFIGGAAIGAVAASVLVALILTTRPDARPGPGVMVKLQDAYAQFLQTGEDVVTYPWAITEAGYEQVTGEVAWSGVTQNGTMVLGGLPPNDPAQTQYQLWIVDPTRDEFPVDGGVFNVADHLADDGKAYVPIDAKLRVDQPAAFAITLEQPGGVVKSNNALLVIAAVD